MVAHPNGKQTGKGMLENVVQPSQLDVLQSHKQQIPIFENA